MNNISKKNDQLKGVRAIDLWINLDHVFDPVSGEIPDWLIRVKEDTFHVGDEFFKKYSVDELVAIMDNAGVEKGVLNTLAAHPSDCVLDFVRQRPDRFFLSADVNPLRMMKELWALEDLVYEFPVVMARVVPFIYDVPPSDAVYYPLYAKCVELDLPISINTGIPGPPKPGECQNPMHLDRVCYRFPDLRICMAHGADPWWDWAIRLMIKYKNLRLMTSAYLPKYLPKQLIHFMNTRGQNKIMFASDLPILMPDRCIKEAQKLDFREGVLDRYLYQNAEDFFFRQRNPRYWK
jgi:predicted TIM-barrel fold metal-dependent hydrolase